MHIVRSNTEKLERHENRERQLGDLLKKGLAILDKRGKAQDAVLETILRSQQNIAERMEKIERVISVQVGFAFFSNTPIFCDIYLCSGAGRKVSRDPTAHGQVLRTLDDLNALFKPNIFSTQQKLRMLTYFAVNSLQDDAERGAYTIDTVPVSMIKQIESVVDQRNGGNRLKEMEATINSKVDYLTSVIEKLQANVFNLNGRLETLSGKGAGSLQEQLMGLVDINRDLMRSLEQQVAELRESQLGNGVGGSKYNNVLAELGSFTTKLDNKLNELTYTENVLADSIRISHNSIENKLADLKSKFDDLNKEAKAIGNVEQVLVKTADDVMDTKRRVEHGIYQIRSEVNDYVKSSQGGSDYNDTVINKFTGMTETLLENQAGAVANLSSKVESEIAQVWRQIGIMHTQITASGITLDNLQNQTNHFVKDTENKMDQMSSKLESIESSIDLVQENNNFLLGRFSLFTHEFNETRGSLAQTTNDLKKVLKQARLFSSDKSPGPHDIDSSPDNLVDNQV